MDKQIVPDIRIFDETIWSRIQYLKQNGSKFKCDLIKCYYCS